MALPSFSRRTKRSRSDFSSGRKGRAKVRKPERKHCGERSGFEDRELIPLYISPHRDREHTIHLLISDDITSHYTFIRNLSRLVAGRTKRNGQAHICPYSFHCFREKHTLENHLPHCSTNTPQVINIPRRGETRFSRIRSPVKSFPSSTSCM